MTITRAEQAAPPANMKMAGDGSGSHGPAKKRKLNEGTYEASSLTSKLFDGLLMSTKASSILRGHSVTSGGASHDQTSTSAVVPTTFFSWGKLPRELKDEIHEWFLMEKAMGAGATKASLWSFTQAFEPLKNQDEFRAASKTMAVFLRRRTSFKATCAYLDLSEAEEAWRRYTDLEALLSPSPPFRNSFHLTIQTCDLSASEATLKAAVWFFWEAMKQWHRMQKRPGTMLLRGLELPVANVADARLNPHKLHSLLKEMQSIPGLPANPEEMLAIANKLRHMITCSHLSMPKQNSLTKALATWLMNIQ